MQTTTITGSLELLLQLRDDLIKAGLRLGWGFGKETPGSIVMYDDEPMQFHMYRIDKKSVSADEYIDLTPENYASTLTELIQRYKPSVLIAEQDKDTNSIIIKKG